MVKEVAFAVLALISATVKGQSGDDVAVTPPMGWNSWDCYGSTITEQEVKANAD